MSFSVIPAVGLSLLLLLPAQAATIYRCAVGGVPTFQDTPCVTPPLNNTEAEPRALVKAHKQLVLEEQKRELIRELRILNLQHRRVAESLEVEAGFQEELAARERRRERVDQDYARREAQIRFKINGIDEQLARLKRP